MIYEFREYDVIPGKRQILLDRFKNQTIDMYRKHNIVPVAFFLEDFPTQGKFVDILGFESYATREIDRPAMLNDPEWREIVEKGEREHGPLHYPVTNRLLVPLPWSPQTWTLE